MDNGDIGLMTFRTDDHGDREFAYWIGLLFPAGTAATVAPRTTGRNDHWDTLGATQPRAAGNLPTIVTCTPRIELPK